jgi:hypothetical protein
MLFKHLTASPTRAHTFNYEQLMHDFAPMRCAAPEGPAGA